MAIGPPILDPTTIGLDPNPCGIDQIMNNARRLPQVIQILQNQITNNTGGAIPHNTNEVLMTNGTGGTTWVRALSLGITAASACSQGGNISVELYAGTIGSEVDQGVAVTAKNYFFPLILPSTRVWVASNGDGAYILGIASRPALGLTPATAWATGTSKAGINIYAGTPGAEADSGSTVTAFNYFFTSIPATSKVWLENDGDGWYVVAAAPFIPGYINIIGNGSLSANSNTVNPFNTLVDPNSADFSFAQIAGTYTLTINNTGTYLVTVNCEMTAGSTSAAWAPGPGVDAGQGRVQMLNGAGGTIIDETVNCPIIIVLNTNLGAPPGTLQAAQCAGQCCRQKIIAAGAADTWTFKVSTGGSTTLGIGYDGNVSVLRLT